MNKGKANAFLSYGQRFYDIEPLALWKGSFSEAVRPNRLELVIEWPARAPAQLEPPSLLAAAKVMIYFN